MEQSPKMGVLEGTVGKGLLKYLKGYDWEFPSENQQGYLGGKEQDKTDASRR